MVKTVHLSDENWERLNLLKIKLRKRSLNEVISELLKSTGIQNYRSTELQNYKSIEIQSDKSTEIPKVVGPSESIERPSEVEEEIPPEVPPEEVLSTEEEGGRFERVEDEVIEEKEEKEKKPSTIGDTIVKILYERAREPKELLKLLIDMGYPPEECERVLEELVKRGAIEVCEVQIGKYGKKTLLRLKGGKRGEEGREGD